MIDFLLSYATLAVAAALFAAMVLTLVFARKRLPRSLRAVLWFLLILLAVYFIFVLWAALSWGSVLPHDPIPNAV